MAQKYYLTQEAIDQFQAELKDLEKRLPEVVEVISAARSQGDLRENSEYQSAREEKESIDERIVEIKNILKNAILLEDSNQQHSVVELGARVELLNLKDNNKMILHIVDTHEADPFKNKISNISPLGKNLMGKTLGDEVIIHRENQDIIYKIVAYK